MYDYHELNFFDTEPFKEENLDDGIGSFFSCDRFNTKRKEHECSLLQPLFNCLPINLIKNNVDVSTQYTHTPTFPYLRIIIDRIFLILM